MKLYLKKELVLNGGQYRTQAHDLRMLGVSSYAEGEYVVFVDGDTIKSMYSFEDMKNLVLNGEGYVEGVQWFFQMSKTDWETQLVPETLPYSTYQNVIDNTDPMNPILETVKRTRSQWHSETQNPVFSPDDTQVIMSNTPFDYGLSLSIEFFADYITILSADQYRDQMNVWYPPLEILGS